MKAECLKYLWSVFEEIERINNKTDDGMEKTENTKRSSNIKQKVVWPSNFCMVDSWTLKKNKARINEMDMFLSTI